MKRLLGICAGVLTLTGTVPAQPGDNPFTPFDRTAFEAWARTAGASEAEVQEFVARAAEMRVALAADELVQQLFDGYRAAVRLSEAGDPAAALELTKVLAATGDPFLKGHVRYHLGRVFLDADDPERTVEVYDQYLGEDRNRTALDAEVMYFYAQALAEIPDTAAATAAFERYLRWFSDVPERYRAAAEQRFVELQAQAESPLHGIADEMKGVERWIRRTRTGKETQDRQQGIIAELQSIIEELEQQEQQSSGSPSGNTEAMNPAATSALPEGEARVGNLGRVPGVADRWGSLPDREREAIQADMQNALPPRYRKMLEQYYKKLGGGR